MAIMAQAQSHGRELYNAAIAVADEDHSELSGRLARVFLPPYFLPAQNVSVAEIDRLMDVGAFAFILDIPPNFQRDFVAGRRPALQVNVDASAMMQAGVGAGYIQQILTSEMAKFATRQDAPSSLAIAQNVRIAFNPNLVTAWFSSVTGIISSVTMLAAA